MFCFNRLSRSLAYALVFATALHALAEPTTAKTQYDADGNQAVQAALFAWALTEHPELAASPQIQMAVRQIEGLPGAAKRPKTMETGPEVEAYLRAVSKAAREIPPPQRIRIEIPASLRNPQSGIYGNNAPTQAGLVLSSQTESIEDTAALLRVYLQWPRLTNAMAEWVLEKPFYLPLPADLTVPERERGNSVRETMLLSVVLDMAKPIARVQGSAPYLSFKGVSADAQIEAVDLVRRVERRNSGTYVADPDQILASWKQPDHSQTALGVVTPVDQHELVTLFGGTVNAERYVPANINARSFGSALGGTVGRIRSSYGPTAAVETALAFGAILAADGERTLSPEAVNTALRSIVSDREKYELFPIRYLKDYGSMNELQRSAALAEAEPKLRALIAARTPQVPLKVRSLVLAAMGDYDPVLKGFPLRASRNDLWMPHSPLPGGQTTEFLPSFLPMPLNEAGELLAAVERRSQHTRHLYIAVDYTLTGAQARPGRRGPIRPEELPLVRYMSRVERVTIYADPELTKPVSVQAYETNPADEPKPLPNAIFATTGQSLMGAIGRQPGARGIVVEAAGSMRDVQRAAPGQRARMADIITEAIVATAMDDYWIGAQWHLGAFDEAKGGFPVKSVHFRPVPHHEDISGISAPELKMDQPQDIEVLRVSAEQRAVIERYLDLTKAESIGGMRLSSYARVQPRGAEQNRGQPILRISAPVELLLGVTQGAGWPQTDDHRVLTAARPGLESL